MALTQTRRFDGREDGIALIAVLWGVTLLAMIALIFSSSVQIETRSAVYQKEAAQAYGLACGGVEAALFEIGYPPGSEQERSPLWTWRGGERQTVVAFRGGRAVLDIENETGKLDLNAASGIQLMRLFEARGLDARAARDLAIATLYWRAPAGDDSASKALDDYYLQAGYRPRHAAFGSVEEVLRIRGMSREIFYGTVEVADEGSMRRKYGVGEDLTIFSKSVPANINYASATVLQSVPGIDPGLAADIIRERTNKPFASIEDAGLRLSGALPGESLPYLTTTDAGIYSVVSTGEVTGSRVRRAVKALLYVRTGGSAPRILLWYDDYRPSGGLG